MCLPLAIPAFAASNTGDWDIAESGKGEKGAYSLFWPKTGTLTAYYYGGVAVTDLNFTYERATADKIAEYQAMQRYPGMEIRDYSDGEKDNFSATSITTNLPNPKTDLEDDPPKDGRNEEAEVTALGDIEKGKYYYMSVDWKDCRNGLTGGQWGVKAELSMKGLIDYNVVDYKYLNPKPVVRYGPTYGEYRVSETETSEIGQILPMNIAPSTVTFNRYVALNEFKKSAENIINAVSYIQLRGIDENGDRITMFVWLDDGWESAKELIDTKAKNKGFAVEGVIAAYVYLDEDQINVLRNSDDVYSVESAGVPMATNNANYAFSGGFPHSVAWELEDLGIIQ